MKNRLTILIIVGLATLGAMASSPRAVAQEPPPRATVTPTTSDAVPPRPTLTPTPGPPTEEPPASSAAPDQSRAQILLITGRENEGRWAVVQWLDGLDDWQNVEGWQGHVSQGRVSWRVLPKDFGKGPYRWVLYDQPNGSELCNSRNFHLPSDRLEQVNVDLSDCTQPAVPVNIGSPSSSPASGTESGSRSGAGSESLYVLRVNHLDDGSVQISIHNIDTFETWHFTSFENLLDYIESKDE